MIYSGYLLSGFLSGMSHRKDEKSESEQNDAPQRRMSMKKKKAAVFLTALALCTWAPQTVVGTPGLIVAEAHSGRTDAYGGHRDNKNKSGLGNYHYHCGGHPAHLHTNGVCPYSGGFVSSGSGSTGSGSTGTGAGIPAQEPATPAVPEHIDRIFDAVYYADHNEDLYGAFGYNQEDLLNHFLTSGMKEGRVASEAFNISVYKENNADLVQAFGDNLPAYYEHYMNFGYDENRICH